MCRLLFTNWAKKRQHSWGFAVCVGVCVVIIAVVNSWLVCVRFAPCAPITLSSCRFALYNRRQKNNENFIFPLDGGKTMLNYTFSRYICYFDCVTCAISIKRTPNQTKQQTTGAKSKTIKCPAAAVVVHVYVFGADVCACIFSSVFPRHSRTYTRIDMEVQFLRCFCFYYYVLLRCFVFLFRFFSCCYLRFEFLFVFLLCRARTPHFADANIRMYDMFRLHAISEIIRERQKISKVFFCPKKK